MDDKKRGRSPEKNNTESKRSKSYNDIEKISRIIKLENYDDYLKLINDSNHKLNIKWTDDIIDGHRQNEIISANQYMVFFPDYNWKDGNINNLHMIGMIIDKKIKSIRHLSSEHIQILEKCKEDGLKIIEEKYKVKSNKIITYFHYHPSTWRLHIHFQNINSRSCGSMTLPRAHPLPFVIQNLRMDSDYYKKCLLDVVVEEKIEPSA
jgi:m7GpppX diphosphatase